MNQLLLRIEFAGLAGGQHAEVFKHQQRRLAIGRAKLFDRLGFNGVGQFAGEIDGRGAHHALATIPRFPLARHAAGDVRLARAAGTVEDERTVAVGFPAQHGMDGDLDQAVLRPDEEMARHGGSILPSRGSERVPRKGDVHNTVHHLGSVLRQRPSSKAVIVTICPRIYEVSAV